MNQRRVFLNAGDVVLGTVGEILHTVLGSCVAVCIHDRRRKIGGMNHFLLPGRETRGEGETQDTLLGDVAIPALLRAMKLEGSQPGDLVIKLAGAAQSVEFERSGVALANQKMARQVLERFGFSISAEDLGGRLGRKIEFDTATGELRVQKIKKTLAELSPGRKIKVLVVEDSLPIQRLLVRALQKSPEIEVIGAAETTKAADAIRKKVKPDVITLDLHLPGEDGVAYLKRTLPQEAVPTLVVTALNIEESGPVMEALEAGAIDCLEKPKFEELAVFSQRLVEAVKATSQASPHKSRGAALPATKRNLIFSRQAVSGGLIAIGASTGGTEALKRVLSGLPGRTPPIVIVQHMPPVFTTKFAERLNEICAFDVKEAQDGEVLKEDVAYIAPGGKHLRVKDDRGVLRASITLDPPVNLFRPSVDYLFGSLTGIKSKKILASVLTGMGSDGAREALKLKERGACIIAQDEATSVVYGMPKAVADLGAASAVVGLGDFAERIVDEMNRAFRATRAIA